MIKKILATVLSMSVCASALAADSEKKWHINPTLGYQFLDGKRDLDAGALLGLGLEYQFNETWGTELKYLQGAMDGDAGNANDADSQHILLEGLYFFNNSDQQFSPYMALGVGHEQYDYDLGGNDDGTTAAIGPGFRYNYNDRWSSKMDVRLLHGLDDSENDGLVTLAISYALGEVKKHTIIEPMQETDTDKDGVNDNNDNCGNTNKGVQVDVNGCEYDDDGDGVFNSKDNCPKTAAGARVEANGCNEKLTRTESIALNVTFATSSAKLTNDFMVEVEKVARFMREYASVSGVIEGHTDSSGSASFNKSLSQRRADTVRTILVEQFGIEPSRLSAVGYGAANPTASNDSSEGRQKNRRVVAVFQAQVSE